MNQIAVTDVTGTPVPIEDRHLLLEEATHYEVTVSGQTSETKVWLDTLALAPSEAGGFSLWTEHMVGHSVLRAETAERFIHISLIIQPRSEKLPVSAWLAMLQEIEEWLPGGTVGVEGAKLGSVGNEGVPAPLLAEALLPLVPLLERSLRIVLENPRQVDTNIWENVPLRSIRRGDREMLKWISCHPSIACWIDPWQQAELRGSGPILPQRRSVDSVDHPANRYVSWLIWRVADCLDRTAEELSNLATNSQASNSKHWCKARSERAFSASKRLRRIWNLSFLKEIHRTPPSEAALMVVMDDPSYQRLHSVGRQFLSPLFSLETTPEKPKAAVRPSFHLYELWCFLAVQTSLECLLEGWKWAQKGLHRLLTLTGSGTGAIFEATHYDGRRLTIEFNPVFASYHERKGARWSISGERRPDIVVSLDKPTASGSWLCLDAKYRVGRRNLADSFSSVHIYRDSLRYDGKGGRCSAAALLSPSSTPCSKDWFSESFIKEFCCGAWELQPGMQIDKRFASWVMKCLGS